MATETAPAGSDRPASGAAGRAARATVLMMAFVLLSRVLGVVRNMVIAHVFGQNATTDVYIRAFAVPDTLYLMLAGGALSTVFIPVFTEYLETAREDEAWRTFGLVVTLVAVATAFLVVLAEVFAPALVFLVAFKFSPEARADMLPLTRTLLPAQWFFFVGGLLMATLQARGRFLVPAAGPVVYNVGIIAGALLLGRTLGVAGMTWGAVVGAFLGNFLLPLWDLRRAGARWRLGLDRKHPGVVRFGQLLLPAMLGLGLAQLGFLITGFFLPEGGELSALKNGYDLTQAPIGIFAQASAMVLFPAISALAAQKNWPEFAREISQGIRRILFLTVPASVLMAVLAEPIIRLLYAGPKFGPAEVADAALALRLYSLGTFAWSAQAVLGRGFFAMQDTRTPLRVTKFMIVAFALLCFLFYRWQGFAGLALAMSTVATVNMLLFLFLLRKRVAGLGVRGIVDSAVRITAAAALSGAAAGVCLRLTRALVEQSKPGAAFALVLAGAAGVAAYVAACALLRVPELRGVRELFRRHRTKEEPLP